MTLVPVMESFRRLVDPLPPLVPPPLALPPLPPATSSAAASTASVLGIELVVWVWVVAAGVDRARSGWIRYGGSSSADRSVKTCILTSPSWSTPINLSVPTGESGSNPLRAQQARGWSPNRRMHEGRGTSLTVERGFVDLWRTVMEVVRVDLMRGGNVGVVVVLSLFLSLSFVSMLIPAAAGSTVVVVAVAVAIVSDGGGDDTVSAVPLATIEDGSINDGCSEVVDGMVSNPTIPLAKHQGTFAIAKGTLAGWGCENSWIGH